MSLRVNILIAGGMILAISILLLSSEIVASIFGFVLGGLNMIIGILTPKRAGITIPAENQDPLKLSLDKGVIRATIYTIAFSEKKLIIRKISSANLTVAAALILALIGAALAGPFGIIVGGITAFSLQEFVTQRRRDEIKRGNVLAASARGDLEFSYDEFVQIGLLRNKIQLSLKNRIIRIAISREHSRIIGPILEKIIPEKILSSPALSERAL